MYINATNESFNCIGKIPTYKMRNQDAIYSYAIYIRRSGTLKLYLGNRYCLFAFKANERHVKLYI